MLAQCYGYSSVTDATVISVHSRNMSCVMPKLLLALESMKTDFA